MIHRTAGQPAPTNEEIAATFKKIEKMIPADQVSTIAQARDSIGGLLGICLAVFEAWQKLDLVISLDSNHKKLATEIVGLQEARESLTESLSIAENDHASAIAKLLSDLEIKKVAVANEKTILDAEIEGLQEEKVTLTNNLAEQKRVFETEAVAELQAKNDELARLDIEIAAAETQLAKTQKAMATLKAKLE